MSRWKKVEGFRSSSNWEDSYFGGYTRVLFDHPEVKVDHNLDFANKSNEMGYYTYNKLIKLFLLCAKKAGLTYHFLNGIEATRHKKWWNWYTRYKVQPASIVLVYAHLVSSNIELSNLFTHYKSEIINTEIWYDVPETDEEKQEREKQESSQNDREKNKEGKSEQGESGDDTQDEQKNKEKEEKKERSGKSEESEEEDDYNQDSEPGDSETPPDFKGSSPGLQVKPEIVRVMKDIFEEVEERKIESHYVNWISSNSYKPVFEILKEGSVCQYSPAEILQANRLVTMLDINFDPAEDKINSLKAGKLDVSKICEVPSGNFNVYYRMEENITTRPFSVCVLVDTSGSMGTYSGGFKSSVWGDNLNTNLDYAASMMRVLYKAFSQILPQEKMFFYSHSSHSKPVISVYHDPYNQNFERTVNQIGMYNRNNYDAPVIESIYGKVREMTDDNIIFIVVSDGQPCSTGGAEETIPQMKRIIEKCKRDGFATLGVGVRYDGPKEIYPYHTIIHHQEEFVKKVSLLVNHVVKTEFQD